MVISESTKTADVNLMSSPEGFQNVVSGAGEAAIP
jgi:hypothetical protein